MSKKATIIAVVNQKGGTGKTTTTENLGVGLALEGKKVLLVDTDPQASLTVSLGNPCPDDLSPTLSDLMGKIMMENPITPDEGILHHPEGVDLVPSNIELSGMEVALVNAMSRETILRQYLDTVKQNYDYILLDCMPSLGMVVLRNDPLVRESMKYNKLTGRIDIVKKLWWNEEVCKLDDDGRTYFYYFFERYYKLTSEKCMDKALRIEANSRAYHPICEYLEQLEWDGQERIRYVLQRYMGADASDFVYEVVKHFLMEALSRIYRPGCKADEMLCLVGQQGAGKSTFFRFLALNDDWFSDDLKQLNDSKIYEHLRGHWIMEMSEMIAAISAKSNEEIKSFLTRQKDTYRNPYDKYEEDRKRQCIFAGSTNTRQFIPFDRTGARRFLPIAIDSSKAEKHILDDEKEARSYFDQLWAEVMEIYWSTENKSSLLKFSKEMEQEISEYRKQFTQEDTMAGMIQGWLDAYKGSHVCSVQIWKEAFDHFDREPKKFETNEICSIMDTQITGWKRAGVHRFSKEGYGRQRSWIREGAEEEGGNEPDKDGFTKLTKAEQLELPFDLPDREKG